MKMRSVGLTAICLALSSIGSVACSGGESPGGGSEVAELGTVSFPLETFGQSGMRYRLHNAIFEVRDKKTARVRAVLNSDDEPFSSILSADLDAGDYQVTLLPGWFIIQSDGSGGDTGPIGVPVTPPPPVAPAVTPTFGSPIAVPGTAAPLAGKAPSFDFEEAVVGVDGGGGFTGATGDTGGGFGGSGATGETGGFGGSGPIGETGGFGGSGATGSSGSVGSIVNAALESNAIQDFPIFPNSGSVVFYTFRVGDNVISFEPGSINVVFQVIEDGVTPPPPPDPCDDVAGAKRPSVIETSTAAVQVITLRDAFNAMAANEGFTADGETLYKQIIDSYATASEGQMADAVHCGDETTNGQPTLNGYPIDCNRQERFQFDNLDLWKATAFVNRFDLAPESGAHCGQQRMIFASNAINRMFFILEAQIPNPQPDLGLEGCAPLAQFWADQVQIEDPKVRGLRLAGAFLSGDPELQSQGFSPFVKASNYTVGTGQIRTNNFDDVIWTLREFKLATEDNDVKAIPFPVAEAPHGALWNDFTSLPNGELCREAFLTSLQGVLVDEPAAMAFVVPQECKDAESRNDFQQDYSSQLSQGSGLLVDQIDSIVGDFGLNAFDIASRAQFAGSCIGCHNEAVGRDLGRGVTAPFSLDFVHVNEFTEICPDGNECFQTSSGLKDTFLPHRLDVLGRFAEVGMPPFCEDDSFPNFDAGAPNPTETAEPTIDAGVALPVGDGGIVPVPVAAELPPAETPVADLVKQDQEIRENFGHRTVGGQDARISH